MTEVLGRGEIDRLAQGHAQRGERGGGGNVGRVLPFEARGARRAQLQHLHPFERDKGPPRSLLALGGHHHVDARARAGAGQRRATGHTQLQRSLASAQRSTLRRSGASDQAGGDIGAGAHGHRHAGANQPAGRAERVRRHKSRRHTLNRQITRTEGVVGRDVPRRHHDAHERPHPGLDLALALAHLRGRQAAAGQREQEQDDTSPTAGLHAAR